MVKKTNWKLKIKDLVSAVGRPEAMRLLEAAGVARTTADKLTGKETRYPGEVGPLLGAAIHRAMEASKQEAS